MNISIQKAIDSSFLYIKNNNFKEEITRIQKKEADPTFWDTPKTSQKLVQKKSQYEKITKNWKIIQQTLENLHEMKEILSEEEYQEENTRLEKITKSALIELYLSEEYDNHNAIITLSVGAGGEDAQDWTSMLLHMYQKYAENKNWKIQIIDIQKADPVGLKSATIKIFQGDHIYGLLKGENGNHRMVRKSPFNAAKSRETSFCHVDIVPEIESSSEVIVEDKDLKIDTFRASGAGGQHVNTTDSAIRITHIPTGIVVQCQNERSQLQNKKQALSVLTSRIADKKRKENAAQQKSLKSEKSHASFGGGHIRSYVLDDQYIKDTRTNLKISAVDKTLQGDLDIFIEAFLLQQE